MRLTGHAVPGQTGVLHRCTRFEGNRQPGRWTAPKGRGRDPPTRPGGGRKGALTNRTFAADIHYIGPSPAPNSSTRASRTPPAWATGSWGSRPTQRVREQRGRSSWPPGSNGCPATSVRGGFGSTARSLGVGDAAESCSSPPARARSRAGGVGGLATAVVSNTVRGSTRRRGCSMWCRASLPTSTRGGAGVAASGRCAESTPSIGGPGRC